MVCCRCMEKLTRKWLISVLFLLLLSSQFTSALSIPSIRFVPLPLTFSPQKKQQTFIYYIRKLIRIEKSIFLIYFKFVMSFLLCHNFFRLRLSFNQTPSTTIFYTWIWKKISRKSGHYIKLRLRCAMYGLSYLYRYTVLYILLHYFCTPSYWVNR